MPDFNYLLWGVEPGTVDPVFLYPYANHSTAMRDARRLKCEHPSWSVSCEVVPVEKADLVRGILDKPVGELIPRDEFWD